MRLHSSGSFLPPASTGTNHAIRIHLLGQAHRNPGIAYPIFSFFNILHYRHELDTLKYIFRRIREPYLARLGLSSSFSVPMGTACIRGGIPIVRSGSAGWDG